jgi:hypothetical protein
VKCNRSEFFISDVEISGLWVDRFAQDFRVNRLSVSLSHTHTIYVNETLMV